MSRLLVVIPARGGSRGIPGKNLARVGGVSLVGRAVYRARHFLAVSNAFPGARVVLDTDDPAIGEEGRRWGAEVPFLRAPELARDDTSTFDSIRGLLARLGTGPDALLLLQPTSPFATAGDVAACASRFAPPDVPSVITVTSAPPLPLAMHTGADGRLAWARGGPPAEVRRQAHAEAVWPNGAVYLTSVPWLLDRKAFVVGGETVGVPMPWTRALDLDDPEDLEAARAFAWAAPRVPWPGGSGEDGLPALLPEGLSGNAEGLRQVRAAGAIEETANRVLQTMAEHAGPIAVDLPGDASTPAGALAQILPLRSLLGVPTRWAVREGSSDEAMAAIALGLSALSGPLPPGRVHVASALHLLR